jgi:hypothetical protein
MGPNLKGVNLKAIDWHAEFGVRYRRPRIGLEQLVAYLKKSWPVNVLLRENQNSTDIILRLPVSSKKLPDNLRAAYFRGGVQIKDAFEETVWNVPDNAKRSPWAQLANAGWHAYSEAWLHLLRIVYLQHFHALAEESLGRELDFKEWRARLSKPLDSYKRSSAGRRKEIEAERRSLVRRFRKLRLWCEQIHKIVETCSEKGMDQRDIRQRIFSEIYGKRGDSLVLRGRAFDQIPIKRRAELHDAKSWKPRQLAIALLAFERSSEYHTIAKKLRAGANR